MDVTLREYRAGDLDALYALDVACFAAEFRFSRRAMRRFVEARGAVTLLAEAAGELAGFCVVQRVDEPRMCRRWMWRRRGGGRGWRGG